MKNLFLAFALVAFTTVGFIACSDDNPCDAITCMNGGTCDNGTCACPAGFTGTLCETAVCEICGTFNGTANGNVQIALTGTDTTFTGLTVTADVAEITSGGTHSVGVDISALLGLPAGGLVPTVNGTYAGSTLTVTNDTFVYSGVASIVINGTVDFTNNGNSAAGDLTLTGDATGSVTFSGTK